MLAARVETSDRVAGLDAGADDYLSPPCWSVVIVAFIIYPRSSPPRRPDGAGSGTEQRATQRSPSRTEEAGRAD